MNIQDELYNPSGTLRNLDATLPVASGSVDRIIAQSVFTHMLQPDIEHYLAEFSRVLKPGGRIFATTFIYDDAILEKARTVNLTPYNLRFEYKLTEWCHVNDRERPTVAVAYTLDALNHMVSHAGLNHLRSPLRGGWSGFFPQTEDGQDVLVLIKG
jgi:cyclopropane fatty-acyl-phospholipid synthase-like methyltransferase